MKRPQFRFSTLLWIIAAVACWFGGMAVQRKLDRPPVIERGPMLGGLGSATGVDTLTMPDGTRWFRPVYRGRPMGRLIFGGEHGEKITVETKPKSW